MPSYALRSPQTSGEPVGTQPTRWMAVDPSLAHCGMVLVVDGHLQECVTLAIPSLVTSYPRMLGVFPRVLTSVARAVEQWTPQVVLYEAPPSSPRLTNTESALLAAAIIETVADFDDLPVGRVECRPARTAVIGRPAVGKSQIREFFEQRCPEWKLRDEHQRDAALIYLAAAAGVRVDWSDRVGSEKRSSPPIAPPPAPPLTRPGRLGGKLVSV